MEESGEIEEERIIDPEERRRREGKLIKNE